MKAFALSINSPVLQNVPSIHIYHQFVKSHFLCRNFIIYVRHTQVIGSPTGIKDIFRDVDAASEIVADSDQFNQGTAASLLEVVIMEMMMRE